MLFPFDDQDRNFISTFQRNGDRTLVLFSGYDKGLDVVAIW